MINRIKTLYKQLFCKHFYEFVRWHWIHGINGNDYRVMEVECKCSHCGKVVHYYPTRGGAVENALIDEYELYKIYNNT